MEVPVKMNGTMILRPTEYVSLRNELNPDQQIILDSLLLTGMRYEEKLTAVYTEGKICQAFHQGKGCHSKYVQGKHSWKSVF